MRNRAVQIYRVQYDQLKWYRLLHLWLMISYVICSVLGSAIVIFGTSFKDQIGTTASLVLNIIGACIVVIGTILMGIITFFSLPKKIENGKLIASEFGELIATLEIILRYSYFIIVVTVQDTLLHEEILQKDLVRGYWDNRQGNTLNNH